MIWAVVVSLLYGEKCYCCPIHKVHSIGHHPWYSILICKRDITHIVYNSILQLCWSFGACKGSVDNRLWTIRLWLCSSITHIISWQKNSRQAGDCWKFMVYPCLIANHLQWLSTQWGLYHSTKVDIPFNDGSDAMLACWPTKQVCWPEPCSPLYRVSHAIAVKDVTKMCIQK